MIKYKKLETAHKHLTTEYDKLFDKHRSVMHEMQDLRAREYQSIDQSKVITSEE